MFFLLFSFLSFRIFVLIVFVFLSNKQKRELNKLLDHFVKVRSGFLLFVLLLRKDWHSFDSKNRHIRPIYLFFQLLFVKSLIVVRFPKNRNHLEKTDFKKSSLTFVILTAISLRRSFSFSSAASLASSRLTRWMLSLLRTCQLWKNRQNLV